MDLFGDEAGHKRNASLAQEAVRVVAFWDGQSRGTADMIRKAIAAGKLEKVYGPDGTELPRCEVNQALSRLLA